MPNEILAQEKIKVIGNGENYATTNCVISIFCDKLRKGPYDDWRRNKKCTKKFS
jgi:hypothetical protein